MIMVDDVCIKDTKNTPQGSTKKAPFIPFLRSSFSPWSTSSSSDSHQTRSLLALSYFPMTSFSSLPTPSSFYLSPQRSYSRIHIFTVQRLVGVRVACFLLSESFKLRSMVSSLRSEEVTFQYGN